MSVRVGSGLFGSGRAIQITPVWLLNRASISSHRASSSPHRFHATTCWKEVHFTGELARSAPGRQCKEGPILGPFGTHALPRLLIVPRLASCLPSFHRILIYSERHKTSLLTDLSSLWLFHAMPWAYRPAQDTIKALLFSRRDSRRTYPIS